MLIISKIFSKNLYAGPHSLFSINMPPSLQYSKYTISYSTQIYLVFELCLIQPFISSFPYESPLQIVWQPIAPTNSSSKQLQATSGHVHKNTWRRQVAMEQDTATRWAFQFLTQKQSSHWGEKNSMTIAFTSLKTRHYFK